MTLLRLFTRLWQNHGVWFRHMDQQLSMERLLRKDKTLKATGFDFPSDDFCSEMLHVGLESENKSSEILIPQNIKLRCRYLTHVIDCAIRNIREGPRGFKIIAPSIHIQISYYVKVSTFEFSRTISNREHDSVAPLVLLWKSRLFQVLRLSGLHWALYWKQFENTHWLIEDCSNNILFSKARFVSPCNTGATSCHFKKWRPTHSICSHFSFPA